MNKKYYNIEERISTYSEIFNIKGKNGLRIYVEDEDNFYFWANNDWALEVPIKTIPEPPKAAFTFIKGLLNQSGTNNPSITIIESTLVDTIFFVRDSTGYYKADLTSLSQGINKTFYYIVQNTNHSDQVFSIRYQGNVLEVRTGSTSGTLQDNLLVNTPFYIEFYS